MPQLDFSHYPSYMMWTFYSFFATYLFISFILIPHFRKITETRKLIILNNIRESEELLIKYEKIEQEIKTAISAIEMELNNTLHRKLKELELKKTKAIDTIKEKEYKILLASIDKIKKNIVDDFLKEKIIIDDIVNNIQEKYNIQNAAFNFVKFQNDIINIKINL